MKRFKFAIFALCIVYVVLMALSVCVESVSDMLSSREHFNKMNCGGFDKTNDYLDDVPPHPNDYKNSISGTLHIMVIIQMELVLI